MVQVRRILQTISDIKITCHDKDIVDVDFSVLKIF